LTGDIPLAYFITWTCYGTWLHGRAPGSVDNEHNRFGDPVLPPDPARLAKTRQTLVESPYCLDQPRRKVVLRTIQEVTNHRRWLLLAAHVRTNHLHVITYAECDSHKVIEDYKAYCTRRLREAGFDSDRRRRWTEGGSKRCVWNPEQLQQAFRYVLDEQGEWMEVFFADEYILKEFGLSNDALQSPTP